MSKKRKIGIVGCGKISGIYLKNLTGMFDNTEVIACADIVPERARAAAAEYGIPKSGTVEEILADPEIEIVLNLTIPAAHAEVTTRALEAGKHVYQEKPLATRFEDGRKILELAAARKLLVGGAPDTFLGAGIQTCRKLIDDGWIGTPIGATAFMTNHGHESWHPDPAFYYQPGAGPMFDMGPYYLTALINLIGPVSGVSGSARITFPERTITSEPKNGEKIHVEVPTHVTGTLEFASGAIGTIITSFDVWQASLPFIEIYGSDGSLSVPDPNTFGGPVRVWRKGATEWQQVPLLFEHRENSRGLGVSDMVRAIEDNRPPRAGGPLTLHVLEIMQGIHSAAESGVRYSLSTSCSRPASLSV